MRHRFVSKQALTFSCCGTFLVLCATFLISCREELPLGGSTPATKPALQFVPGDHFSYDNWKLDFYGGRIPSSYFRNSWTVVDTGVSMYGRTGVAVLVDTTFDPTNQLITTDSLFFCVDEKGDLFQYGFLSSLIAERESLTLTPQWDRIAAFSVPREQAWVMARIDTSMGAQTTQNVIGRIRTTLEYVGPVMVDGEERAILSHRIEISKPNLDYVFWLSDAPTSFPRVVDDSEILPNTMLRELKVLRPARR